MPQQGIFSRLFIWLFGANWKTSALGLGTILCAIVHEKPTLIHWVPEPFQSLIWSLSEYAFYAGAAGFAFKVKDKNVTGGSVQQTQAGATADEQSTPLVCQTPKT